MKVIVSFCVLRCLLGTIIQLRDTYYWISEGQFLQLIVTIVGHKKAINVYKRTTISSYIYLYYNKIKITPIYVIHYHV